MKTLTTITFIIFLNILSYTKNNFFKSLNIQFTDSKGNLEYFPDLIVTYNCANYEEMKGLHMMSNSNNTLVTVNYGGWGRRRGFRDFNCLSK